MALAKIARAHIGADMGVKLRVRSIVVAAVFEPRLAVSGNIQKGKQLRIDFHRAENGVQV